MLPKSTPAHTGVEAAYTPSTSTSTPYTRGEVDTAQPKLQEWCPPELRAFLANLPTKKDLNSLPSRRDFENFVLRVESAMRHEVEEIQKTVTEVTERVDSLEASCTTFEQRFGSIEESISTLKEEQKLAASHRPTNAY